MKFMDSGPFRMAVMFLLVFTLVLAMLQNGQPVSCRASTFSVKPGVYYYRDATVDPLREFSRLSNAGIRLRELWYKPGASQCCPDNSDVCLMALVMPRVLVRLNNQDSRMKDFGYSLTDRPGMGFCPVHVVECSRSH